jgi:hypothetical protein
VIELHITDTGIIKTVYSDRGQVTSSITYPTENNLPDDVKTKLSALKLMTVPDDIPDVGQKVSDTLYWIYEGTKNDLSMELQAMMVFSVVKGCPMYIVNKELVDKLMKGYRHANTNPKTKKTI